MRAFVAIDLPDEVLGSLEAFQADLSATGADLKAVERQNLHFTVKFLGEISEAQAAEARSRLSLLEMKSADVDVKGVGAFPSVGRPRVVWAGVAPEHEGLIGPIARNVVDALGDIGESEERPFQAHITLGRVRSLRNVKELGELLRRNSGRPFGSVTLSEVKLKSSVLTPQGPIYRDVGVFRLK
ncbi:MAG: RNA 2',3'-cyclic phosphodiesterase [Nitrososphaerota archaeon]|nr:RNA 2',3'-cyclic phosphodiesterase [Nitrososphaerota archaeon]